MCFVQNKEGRGGGYVLVDEGVQCGGITFEWGMVC